MGGFSDAVFRVIDSFVKESSKDHWTAEIERVMLSAADTEGDEPDADADD